MNPVLLLLLDSVAALMVDRQKMRTINYKSLLMLANEIFLI